MMSELCKLSYIVNAISIEILKECFSVECANLALKFMWKSKDELQRKE